MEPKALIGLVVLAGMAFFGIRNYIRDRRESRRDKGLRTHNGRHLDWSKIKGK